MRKVKSKCVFCYVILLLMLLVLLLSIVACNSNILQNDSETDDAVATVEIKTTLALLKFPEKLIDNMYYEEVHEGNELHVIFYMVRQNGEWEIFRIIFGDDTIGTLMGYLETDSGEISVSYLLAQHSGDDFSEDEDWDWYYKMMDAVGVVLLSIQENNEFHENGSVKNIGSHEATFRYWKLNVPSNIHYNESEENGSYCIEFYGQIGEEIVELYTIALGHLPTGVNFGSYTVNGKSVPVMIATCDVTEYDHWTDVEKDTLYQMMDSLNDVIAQIRSSKLYSDPSIE